MDHWRNQRENLKKNVETNDNTNIVIQNLWDIEKTVLRGKAIVIRFKFRRKRKFSNKQSKITPKATRERRTNKP